LLIGSGEAKCITFNGDAVILKVAEGRVCEWSEQKIWPPQWQILYNHKKKLSRLV